MIAIKLSNGEVRDIVTPESMELKDVQRFLVERPDVWPEDADVPGWFYNPLHIIGIREFE